MKIIRRSNFDHEDSRGDEVVVAENVTNDYWAMIIVDALNLSSGPDGEHTFVAVPDDYQLTPKWQP